MNFFVDERLGRIPDPNGDDKFVGIYVRHYPDHSSKSRLAAIDSTTSSNRNWDLTHKISESTEKSETDKVKSIPKKFYERLMQKNEPVRPTSRNRAEIDLYPTKTQNDTYAVDNLKPSSINQKCSIIKNRIGIPQKKNLTVKIGIVKHNNNTSHNTSHNTSGNSSRVHNSFSQNKDINNTVNLRPSSPQANKKKVYNSIMHNNLLEKSNKNNHHIHNNHHQTINSYENKETTMNTIKGTMVNSRPGSKTKKRPDTNSYLFNNS